MTSNEIKQALRDAAGHLIAITEMDMDKGDYDRYETRDRVMYRLCLGFIDAGEEGHAILVHGMRNSALLTFLGVFLAYDFDYFIRSERPDRAKEWGYVGS